MENTELEIPDELLLRVELLAEKLGITVHDFMLAAIENSANQNSK